MRQPTHKELTAQTARLKRRVGFANSMFMSVISKLDRAAKECPTSHSYLWARIDAARQCAKEAMRVLQDEEDNAEGADHRGRDEGLQRDEGASHARAP